MLESHKPSLSSPNTIPLKSVKIIFNEAFRTSSKNSLHWISKIVDRYPTKIEYKNIL